MYYVCDYTDDCATFWLDLMATGTFLDVRTFPDYVIGIRSIPVALAGRCAGHPYRLVCR